jgi:hypothetical protein
MISRRWKRTDPPGQVNKNILEKADDWLKAKLLFLGRTFLWHEMNTESFRLPFEPQDNGPFGQIGPRGISHLRSGMAVAGRAAASPFGAFITVTVGDSAVRVLVARGNRVRRWAEAQLPVGVVQDGLIVDEQTFTEALNAVISEIGKGARLNGAKVAVAITGRNVVQRRFTVFLEQGENLTEAIIDASAERMSIRPEELQLAWDAARADYNSAIDDVDEDENDALSDLEADLGPDGDGEPYDVYAFGMYRHVLRRNLRTLATAGAKFSAVQPKAIALAAAANERSGVILDIESNSITVVVLRDGLPEVVREVGIDERMTRAQWVQSVTTQVSRTVAFHDSMYPDSPLPADSPLFLTGATESIAGGSDEAAAAIPYRRKSLQPTLRAPDDFPFARYAANVGLALVTGKHWWQRTRVAIIDRPALDFRPSEFRPRPFPVQATLTISAIAILLAGVGGAFQLGTSERSNVTSARDELASLRRQANQRDLSTRKATERRAEVDALVAQANELLDKLELLGDRDRGFAETISVLADTADRYSGLTLLEIDDDGSSLGVSIGADDFTSLLSFVKDLERQEGFLDLQIRTVGAQQAAGEEGGVAAPQDAGEVEQTGPPITVNLKIERTPQLEPLETAEAAQASQN